MSETLALSRIPLDQYAELLGASEIEELRALAKPLRGRSIEMINSTAVGGGVAEILNRLVPLAEELEINIKWDVMMGGEDFFEVTKSFHNALHGAPYHASPKDFEIFLAYSERNRATLPLDAEFVVIHDPQPAALIETRRPGANHWVALPHRSFSSQSHGLGLPREIRLAIRLRPVFFAGILAAASDSAVFVLSGDRPIVGKKLRP
jgi:trehalose synthase